VSASQSSDKYLDAQRAVIQNLFVDAREGKQETIKVLMDQVGLNSSFFGSEHLRLAYQVFQRLYVDSAQNGVIFGLPEVFTTLELEYRTNGHEDNAANLVGQWRDKVDGLDKSLVGSPRSAAQVLMTSGIKKAIKKELPDFSERIRKAQSQNKLADELAGFGYFLLGLAESSNNEAVTLTSALEEAQFKQSTSTGYRWLDKEVLWNRFTNSGGFSFGSLIIWMAPSGHGKTSVAASLASRQALAGRPTIFLTAEESTASVALRVFSAVSGLPAHAFLNPSGKEEEEAKATAMEIANKYVFAYEFSNMADIETKIRRHKTQFGKNSPMLVVLDHISALDSGAGNWSRDLEQVAKSLKQLAMRQDVCLLVFSQVPVEMETELRKKNFTHRADARGSRGIRMWADYVVVSCRHNGKDEYGEYDPRFNTATVIQRQKNRYDTARAVWGTFEFDPALSIITDNLLLNSYPAKSEF